MLRYLAKAGFNVTVLKRCGILGGATVTQEFHSGFRNSVASYTVSLLHPQVIDTVTEYAPKFRHSIVGSHVSRPFDLETEFGLVGGDIYHDRLSLDQLFSARPMLGSGQYATEISNLYLCGAGMHD